MDCGDCDSFLPTGVAGAMIKVRLRTCDGPPFDLTDAVSVELLLKPPSGPTLTRVAGIDPPPTRGVVWYITDSSDFSVHGVWQYQVRITLTGGRIFYTKPKTITIYKNL